MCGILGLINTEGININSFLSRLSLLQHRGQESYGYGFNNGSIMFIKKDIGFVKNDDTSNLEVDMAIGHVRYSTSGKSKKKKTEIGYDDNERQISNEIQPFFGNCKFGKFALAHNGNIPNIKELSLEFGLFNYLDTCNSDTEFIVAIIEKTAPQYNSWEELLKIIVDKIDKAFSIIIMTENEMFAMRDKHGVKPMCLGTYRDGWCISSESIALEEYSFLRNIFPGEIIKFSEKKMEIIHRVKDKISHCLFEYFYFLSDKSVTDGLDVFSLRWQFGETLARQDIAEGLAIDNPIVVGSPTTGIAAGRGYAIAMDYEYNQVLTKNEKIGRTFIMETALKREEACKLKYIIDKDAVNDRNIVIVDDSLVRGTTMKTLIKLFKEKGAKSIHIRIAAPPIKNPCFYGIDIPDREQLIANQFSEQTLETELTLTLDAASVKYLKLERIKKLMYETRGYCTGCFNGNYDGDW